mmetsp:Transcript_51664/g.165185  ORF Transcript_51664/g.165185 Transcript_51664/m.165185 type:complete len:247 (-) Transcript_51664:130-870(-)
MAARSFTARASTPAPPPAMTASVISEARRRASATTFLTLSSFSWASLARAAAFGSQDSASAPPPPPALRMSGRARSLAHWSLVTSAWILVSSASSTSSYMPSWAMKGSRCSCGELKSPHSRASCIRAFSTRGTSFFRSAATASRSCWNTPRPMPLGSVCSKSRMTCTSQSKRAQRERSTSVCAERAWCMAILRASIASDRRVILCTVRSQPCHLEVPKASERSSITSTTLSSSCCDSESESSWASF